MKHRFACLIAVVLVAVTFTAGAATSVADAFKNAPDDIFPLLSSMSRMDMIDYYNSPNNAGASNSYNGISRITSMTPDKMSIEMSKASNYDIVILPSADGTSDIIGLISTVKSPTPDSSMSFFKAPGWEKIADGKIMTAPSLKDWLTPEGRSNQALVESFVPFIISQYDYDPASATLTITNNLKEFLAPDMYDMVKDYLKPSLTYKWDGKKMVKEK